MNERKTFIPLQKKANYRKQIVGGGGGYVKRNCKWFFLE